MKRSTIVFFLVLIATGALFFSCGPLSSGGGSGTEIVGNVELREDSTSAGTSAKRGGFNLPAIEIPVFLYPRDIEWKLDNLSIPRVKTDKNGSFRFTGIPRGEYFVEANNGSGKSARREVDVTGERSVIDVGTLTLVRGTSILDELFGW